MVCSSLKETTAALANKLLRAEQEHHLKMALYLLAAHIQSIKISISLKIVRIYIENQKYVETKQ